jgi:hypothetical protein
MASAFVVDTQQTGPQGADKFYSSNWGMFDASHKFAGGTFMFQLMLSLDPATITDRRYPELFQTGETAYGKPLVNAQHPHDFIMNLGVHYAHSLGEHTMLQLYFAPVGDPALGPVAFPHRASAAELPQAPLGHHWEDSTHIANEVLTAGILSKKIRLEASEFYGSEPDENRWNIDHGPMNSWSHAIVVLSVQELAGSGISWTAGAAGAARAGRCSPQHGIAAVHSAHAERAVVHQSDLGAQSSVAGSRQLECIFISLAFALRSSFAGKARGKSNTFITTFLKTAE